MKCPEESLERIQGLFNIAITPFAEDGSIDFVALEANTERILEFGYDGLLVGGTYGEFATMDVDERVNIFRSVMSQVGNHLPVLLCTAHSDSRVVFELTRLAGEMGGLPMVTAPYVSEVNERHILEFFELVSGYSSTGIMVYNAPGIGITLSPELIGRLADIDGVVGLKQGDLDPTAVDVLCGEIQGRIRVLAASDLALLGPLALGFDGVSSTNSCALPELIHSIHRAIMTENTAVAGRLQRLWYPLRKLTRQYGQPQTTKAIMKLRGWEGGHVRLPLLDLSDDQVSEVGKALSELASHSDASVFLAA